jgi:hypothetical protein
MDEVSAPNGSAGAAWIFRPRATRKSILKARILKGQLAMPTFPSPLDRANRSPRVPIPYSLAALRQDLRRVRDVWVDCQASRDRNAIYAYLNAVYGLVAWWAAEGQEIDRARRALCFRRLEVSAREDPFASIIRCTADPAKADKRTRSKWSRIMRYATVYKSDSEPLFQFIKRKRGINACAARFTRRLGRAGR